MAQFIGHLVVPISLLLLIAVSEASRSSTFLRQKFQKTHTRSLLNVNPSESGGQGSSESGGSHGNPSPSKGHNNDQQGHSDPSPPDNSHDNNNNHQGPPESNRPPEGDNHQGPSEGDDNHDHGPSPPKGDNHDNNQGQPSSPPPPSQTPIIYVPPPPPTSSPPSSPSSSLPPTPPTTPSSAPPSTPPTTPSTPSTSPKTARCKNKYYPRCYNTEHVCPSACPGACEVDCVTCKPVCKCDRPGAVCQDPRFIGGDGITFYFHGKKDRDFCLVSDPNFHINAHFIGKRNEKLTRDFTWVQSIAVLFEKHQLFLGALKTSTWDDSVDRLTLSFDGEPLNLLDKEGTNWQSTSVPAVSVTRISNSNNVMIEIEGLLKITAKVVPITEQDSRIHNYGITKDDCFAHLDLGLKFYSLSNEVEGVLGQTYRPGYVSRLNVGAKMAVMGGNKEFATSSLFTPDCAVARYKDGNGFEYGASYMEGLELPSMRCASGIDGEEGVCKR